MNKILIVVGPTSSGKSELAVQLAKKFNGEIISCDSRQIYRGLDLGTGKIPGKWVVHKTRGRVNRQQVFVYKSIVHHCIDYISPKRQYSAGHFQLDAKKSIADMLGRGKLPILCGGTGHWIDAVVFNQQLPDVKPNLKLRVNLEKKSANVLYKKLLKLDPARAKTIDRFNKRRLIRALEIISVTGKPVPAVSPPAGEAGSQLSAVSYAPLWLRLNPNQKSLYQKIDKRLYQRIKAGMVNEVENLHKRGPLSPLLRGDVPPMAGQRGGLPWKRLISFGLEYKYISLYLQKKLKYDEMLTQLSYAIKHYSKRQMTWWKKNKEIVWLKNPKIAEQKVKRFLR